MRKILKIAMAMVLAVIMLLPASTTTLYAAAQARPGTGQMSFFGGITEGVRLPTTAQVAAAQTATRGRGSAVTELVYKEIIWLAGVPVEFEGTLRVQPGGTAVGAAGLDSGQATVNYRIEANAATGADGSINRNITFRIDWRREGNQIVENYTVTSWTETIIANGTTFTLIPAQSNHNVSILRDITPGVTYYSGNISMRAVYTTDDDSGLVTHEVMGQIYGFLSAWSATETHRLDGIVSTDEWQMQYHLVPSVSVSKELQYGSNEPTLISFDGNYREVMSNQSGLLYEINILPNIFYGTPTTGRATISTFNTFEDLFAPNLNFLQGHAAFGDIRRLFAMEVLSGDPAHFVPNQGVTRGEFIMMLSRAVRLPLDESLIPQPPRGRGNNQPTINLVFPDVDPSRPDFLYIMTVNDMGIAIGRGDGHFHPNEILRREEAFVLALRFLGLSNLGMEPTPITPFMDDHMIGDWARRDIYAASRIGLIWSDENGMLHPQELMYKAEAAALINRLIEFMRHELVQDYTDNIINFMN
ncbi:MAG: S-layer homology domain-containing protein [Defluviitaleaceae bacterium]|nr:S-layer homology domain-containing protein [Defluviitaleaceae bacterium]